VLRKDFVQSLGRDLNDKIYASAINLPKSDPTEQMQPPQLSLVPENLQGKVKVKKTGGKKVIIIKRVVKRSRQHSRVEGDA